jgi:hypothetical protein
MLIFLSIWSQNCLDFIFIIFIFILAHLWYGTGKVKATQIHVYRRNNTFTSQWCTCTYTEPVVFTYQLKVRSMNIWNIRIRNIG